VRVLLIAAIAWLLAASWRQQQIKSDVEKQLQSGALASVSDTNVRVPIVPLLVNPFRRDTTAYIYQGNVLYSEIRTTKR
jgi:hypothetical protein